MRAWQAVWWVAAAVALAAGCGPRKAQPETPAPKPQAEEEEPNLPQHIRLSGGQFVLTAPDGKRLWQGQGKSFDWDAQAQAATLKDARCTFFQAGKEVLKGAAPQIRVDSEARVVYLDQGVKADSLATGASFSADRVEWRARKQEVRAQGNVELVRGQSSAQGDRMIADTALKRVRLEGEGRPVALRIVQKAGKALW